jgi:pilus assembly protein CpaE
LRRCQAESGLAPGGPQQTSPQQSQIIAVMGARGGVGSTSVAVNLACTLAATPGNSSVLIDLDMALGDADISLDLMPDHTLADLALNIERLDMNFMKRSMVKHEATGVNLLAHPLQISDIGVVHEDHIIRILNLLRISYSHLVLDLSKALVPIDLAALRMADHVLLVSQLELASLRNVVRILMALGQEEGLSEKVRVVMNRVGADYAEGDISLKKAEETIGKPIFWQLPNDAKPMLGSRVAGMPLIQHSPRSKVQQSIAGMAEALLGKAPAQQTPNVRSSTGLLGRLVGSKG